VDGTSVCLAIVTDEKEMSVSLGGERSLGPGGYMKSRRDRGTIS